jgi:hypothetical protein
MLGVAALLLIAVFALAGTALAQTTLPPNTIVTMSDGGVARLQAARFT